MSIIRLEHVGTYVRTGRAPQAILAVLRKVRQIFTFVQERENRVKRYVKVVKAYRDGMPVADIEREYGCCRQTVLRYARLAGLPKRPKCFEPDIRKAVIALYKEGRPIAEIQARLGVSQAYISKTATEEGINRRDFSKTKRKRSS